MGISKALMGIGKALKGHRKQNNHVKYCLQALLTYMNHAIPSKIVMLSIFLQALLTYINHAIQSKIIMLSIA